MESIIAAALASHQWYDATTDSEDPATGCTGCDDWFGDENAVDDGIFAAHQARAVLAAISEAGAIEWGVAWDGITVDPMEAVSHDAARATAAMLTRLSNDGDPAYAITRITFPWERAE